MFSVLLVGTSKEGLLGVRLDPGRDTERALEVSLPGALGVLEGLLLLVLVASGCGVVDLEEVNDLVFLADSSSTTDTERTLEVSLLGALGVLEGVLLLVLVASGCGVVDLEEVNGLVFLADSSSTTDTERALEVSLLGAL